MSIAINRGVEHLQFIYDRMVSVHGEDPRVDYMKTLQSVLDDLNRPETLAEKLKRTKRFTV
jgi:hypothetical protein